jgi:lon-related putative ATP-dependent protease
MEQVKPLLPEILRPACDPSQFKFTTTADLKKFVDRVGLDRAIEALEFGIEIHQPNYNLYIIGAPGAGKRTILLRYLEKIAAKQKTVFDWCYVHNFDDPNKPRVLMLPKGYAKKLRQDMVTLVEQFRFSIPAILESAEFRKNIQRIEEKYKESEAHSLRSLEEEAEAKEMTVLRTPTGFTVAPTRNGKILSIQEIEELPTEERKKKEKVGAELGKKLNSILEKIAKWHKDMYEKEKEVEQKFCTAVVITLISQLSTKYADLPNVLEYLKQVQQDIIENPKQFLKQEVLRPPVGNVPMPESQAFIQYQVNVFISNDEVKGAPIIVENNPNYANIIGRIEYKAQFGILSSDFTLIKPGALHKANGGYLVLDILKVLQNPYVWESLKRTLHSQQVQIETLVSMLGFASSTPLEPEPIPLNLKVILKGNRYLYNILGLLDVEFKKLFKVAVDFDEDIKNTKDTVQQYARLIARLGSEEKLLPFHRNAVAGIIDYCTRLTGYSGRIALNMQSLTELMSEAHYWARTSKQKIIRAVDVQKAVDMKVKRVDQLRQQLYEEIENGTIFIEIKGESIGQINALSVLETADFVFGHPSRITATTRLGDGHIVNIEREVKLSGPIHSKGVMILSGYLKGRYAQERPLSLSASLVFEQTYGMIDGDSASAAELCALLSSLAQVPIKQSFAITGSINQHGQVQPIGGVNEKIEAFFDICKMFGLKGKQGVLIPMANVKNLMLRQDVVKAVEQNKFHVYPIATIDQALFLLTGKPAKSIHERCEKTLQHFADLVREAHHR